MSMCSVDEGQINSVGGRAGRTRPTFAWSQTSNLPDMYNAASEETVEPQEDQIATVSGEQFYPFVSLGPVVAGLILACQTASMLSSS